MRIGLLSSQRGYYGGEVHLQDLAGALRERGHRVACLVRRGGELAPRLQRDLHDVHALRLVDWYDPVGMAALVRLLRRLRLDILHAHCPRDYYITAAATLGLPVRLVGTRHQLRPIAWPRLKRPFLDRLALMIAVSEAVRDGLLASGFAAGRLVTVPNGIRLPAAASGTAASAASTAALRRELELPAGCGPVVGCVGLLCATKGQDVLLRAAARLRGPWPDLQIVLIGGPGGDGRFAADLRRLAAELRLSVRFCGYREEAARLLPALDVLAVPSLAEPFGLVTLEALARGVPVVATLAGGSREIIRDGRDGLLVPPKDPAALAAALHRLLADGELRARLQTEGPRRVAERFTLARQAAQTEEVYARALAGLSPAPVRR